MLFNSHLLILLFIIIFSNTTKNQLFRYTIENHGFLYLLTKRLYTSDFQLFFFGWVGGTLLNI